MDARVRGSSGGGGLTLAAAAVTASSRSFTAIAGWAADVPAGCWMTYAGSAVLSCSGGRRPGELWHYESKNRGGSLWQKIGRI